jgi:Domain of unknown function (DUF4157)
MTAEGPVTLKASAPAKSAPAPHFGVLQRQCACGGAAGLDGECAECTQTGMSLQRRSSERAAAGPVPPAVHEVLGSPGTSLDSATRAYMEPRFGLDFSRVRVHADERAAESARAVHALAYTVGRDIVFGAGQPMPPAGDIFDQAPSIYCQQVTGSPFEYEVTTPTGERTQFDALVGEDIVIECKCGYETIPDALEAKEGTRREVAQLRMDAIDKQQAKHSKVAAACGLRLAYVVSNQRFQQLLTSRWLSQVPIVHKPWREVCGKP